MQDQSDDAVDRRCLRAHELAVGKFPGGREIRHARAGVNADRQIELLRFRVQWLEVRIGRILTRFAVALLQDAAGAMLF